MAHLVTSYVDLIHKIPPLCNFILAHDKEMHDRTVNFYRTIAPHLNRRNSSVSFRGLVRSSLKTQDPIRDIVNGLIDSSKSSQENESYILEFIRIRLFRMNNEVEEWRFYRCLMSPYTLPLVRLISTEFKISRMATISILYTIKVLELIQFPLPTPSSLRRPKNVPIHRTFSTPGGRRKGLAAFGKQASLSDMRRENEERLRKEIPDHFSKETTELLGNFFKHPSYIRKLRIFLKEFILTDCFPLFFRVAMIQEKSDLEEFIADYYSMITLNIPTV